MIALLLVIEARAEQPCRAFYTPADVVEAAMRVQGARTAAPDEQAFDERAELRTLLTRLSCVSDPLTPGDAAAVHLAIGGARAAGGPKGDPPPKPPDGVALVDGVPHARRTTGQPAVVQAFDADGRVVYTRWLPADAALDVLPAFPAVPSLPPVPLGRGELARLVASSALVAASGVFFLVAADARADWYALDPSPVTTVTELERLRVRTNVTQGAGLACAGVGAAGLLSVAVRVPF